MMVYSCILFLVYLVFCIQLQVHAFHSFQLLYENNVVMRHDLRMNQHKAVLFRNDPFDFSSIKNKAYPIAKSSSNIYLIDPIRSTGSEEFSMPRQTNCIVVPQLENAVRVINQSMTRSVATAFVATQIMILSSVGALLPQPTSVAHAAEGETSRVVGQLQGSGLFFKDTLQIESFDDPKVKGVKLYISTFQIPLTERFGKNMFSDPSYASVACTRVSGTKVAIADNIAKGLNGEEVFEEKKSLLFKELRVYRVYDEEANTVVYVSFNTRIDKGDDTNKSRFKSSLCAINLD